MAVREARSTRTTLILSFSKIFKSVAVNIVNERNMTKKNISFYNN